MPAVIATVALVDAESVTRLMRTVDLSGTGSGPWVPLHALADRFGEAVERDNPLSAFRAYKHATSGFARSADAIAYATGQIVTDSKSVSFASAVPSFKPGRAGGGVAIRTIRLRKTSPVIANATFRIHFFKAPPTGIANDGAAFAAAGNVNYLGVTADGAMAAMTDGATALITGALFHRFGPAEDTLYWLLEARGAYTPASGENFELEVVSEHD